jgi:hypothetical protein
MLSLKKQIEKKVQARVKKANKATAKMVKAELKKKEKEILGDFYAEYHPDYYVRKNKLKESFGDLPNTYNDTVQAAEVNIKWDSEFISGEPYTDWRGKTEGVKEVVVSETLGYGRHGVMGACREETPKARFEREAKEYVYSRKVANYYNSFFE